MDYVWKLIDMATAATDEEATAIHFSLRYAAPEVVKAALQKETCMVYSTASDMWSLGVVMYEMYLGTRLFDEALTEEEVAALLCSPAELQLKGLQNIDQNAARFINKLLVKVSTD